MRMRLENSFAPNSFKGRKIVKTFFAVVSPLRLCNCRQLCNTIRFVIFKRQEKWKTKIHCLLIYKKKIKNKKIKKMPKKRTKR